MINKEKIKSNWMYVLISQPDIYVWNLIRNTLFVGAITFVLTYLYLHSSLADKHIPSAVYSLVAFAIGLTLAMRMSTAYERWSSGSRHFNELHNSITFICMKARENLSKPEKEKLITHISLFLTNFNNTLRNLDDKNDLDIEQSYLEELHNIMSLFTDMYNSKEMELGDMNVYHKTIQDIIISAGSCVRIKNTPIPVAISMHIKVSVMLYILSLPFGLFSDMGMWSTLMVMVLYYIIAGIEIISKEIENPFYGDANDLPIDQYVKKIEEMSKRTLNI